MTKEVNITDKATNANRDDVDAISLGSCTICRSVDLEISPRTIEAVDRDSRCVMASHSGLRDDKIFVLAVLFPSLVHWLLGRKKGPPLCREPYSQSHCHLAIPQ